MKNYPTPDWLNLPFLIGIAILIALITIFARKNAPIPKQNWVAGAILIFFGIYIGYVFVAGQNGWFAAATFPPKILLLTTLPYAVFLFLVVYKWPITETIIENASLEGLIGLHIFRLVGFTFVILALHKALPTTFAFIAGFGDVITAVTSLIVVYAIKNNKTYARKLAFVWNTFGFIDILFTALMANILTKISIDTGAMGVDSLAKFPFSLIPAIAPPTIIFLHFIINKKLKKIRERL